MKLIISYYTSNFNVLQKHWKKKSILKEQGVMGTNQPLKDDLGGLVRILDWESKEIEKDFYLDRPSGIAQKAKMIFIVSGGNQINVFSPSLEPCGVISSPYLNNLHTIFPTIRGILVSSSGLDLILEIDLAGNSLYEWWAVDHGLDKTPLKEKRSINRYQDHRFREYPTLSQTTHVNSAIYVRGESVVLATLFFQGCILEIDKRVNSARPVMVGLSFPHSIYQLPGDDYLVSDTKVGRALILDGEFEIKKELKIDTNWLQDTIYTPQGTYLMADSNNFSIVEISEGGQFMDVYEYESDLKVSQIAVLGN